MDGTLIFESGQTTDACVVAPEPSTEPPAIDVSSPAEGASYRRVIATRYVPIGRAR